MSVSTMTAEEVEPRQSAMCGLFAAMRVAAFVSIWFLRVETRGRSLAQIQQMRGRGSHRRPHSPQTEKVA